MTWRFGMISNPLSHSVSKRGSILEAAAERENDAVFRCLHKFPDLRSILQDFSRQGVNALFVEGGDGTAMAVISEILSGRSGMPKDTPIGLLPGGMTNLAAKVMGVHKAGKGGIRELLTDLRTGALATRRHDLPLLEIRLVEDAQPIYGFFLSTGALPNGIRFCRRKLHSKGASGSIAVGLTLARLIFGPRSSEGNEVMRPSDLTLETSAFHAAGSHLFTLATTLPEFNLKIDPFWGTEDAPLKFTHATWPANGLVRAMLGIIAGASGRTMRKRGMESFNIDEALMVYDGDIVLDGEFLSAPPSGKIKVSTTRPAVFRR